MQRALLVFLPLLALLAAPARPAAARDAGVRIELYLESGQVQAGGTVTAAAVVTNPTRTDRFVIVTGFLAPVREPILIPPVRPWERFVWEILAEISEDSEVIHVPAGQSRAVKLSIEVHPRVHGRFDVVATARTLSGETSARKSVVSRITAPPSSGGVLVHGKVYELGTCRLLVTDDGHLYEPEGPRADEMFRLLDLISPRPDGVTVLGGIRENTSGCFGVELEVDLFRFDREPGTPVGVRWRSLARGSTVKPYPGPDEEVIRNAARFEEVVKGLGAKLTGRKPNFRKEMAVLVSAQGNLLTRACVTRVVEEGGELVVHYLVTRGLSPILAADRVTDAVAPEVMARGYHLVALPKYGGPVRFVRHEVDIRTDAPKTGVLDVAEDLVLTQARRIPAASAIGKALRKKERDRRRTLLRSVK